jgi:hypothetical protein
MSGVILKVKQASKIKEFAYDAKENISQTIGYIISCIWHVPCRPKAVAKKLSIFRVAAGSRYPLQVLGLLRSYASLWAFRFYRYPGRSERDVRY